MAIDISALAETQTYQATVPVPAIQLDIAVLRSLDKHHEARQKLWYGLAIVTGIIAVVTLFFCFLPITIPAVIAMVIFICLGRGHRKLNLVDRRYELLDKLLFLIGRDVGKEMPIEVAADLGEPDRKTKFKGKGEVAGWNVEYYEDPWLRLRGRFLDGNYFVCTAAEMLQKRSAWKRGSSGKSKHKTKVKSATRVEVKLKFKPEKYQGLAELKEIAGGAVQLPPNVELKDLQFGEDTLGIETAAKVDWNTDMQSGEQGLSGPEMFAMIFLSLYQILNLARGKKKA